MQHGPRGPPRGPMQFKRDFPPMEDPAREKAVRSIFGTLADVIRSLQCIWQ